MNSRQFRAMNVEWWIGRRDGSDLCACEATVHEAERRYSRFRADSVLSRLNRERRLRDPQLALLVAKALELHGATSGAFDVRVGGAMHAAGYDRTFEAVATSPRCSPMTSALAVTALQVEVEHDEVRLGGTGFVDLGGIAKGWTVDQVARQLERAGCTDYVVDGGGDIRASGRDERGEPWIVGIAEGRFARIENAAVCTSSMRRRRWRTAEGEAHHIIDPRTAMPSQHEIVEAVVIAPEAAVADALATTLIAQPERALSSMAAFDAEAFFLRRGRWEMTGGMRKWLTRKTPRR